MFPRQSEVHQSNDLVVLIVEQDLTVLLEIIGEKMVHFQLVDIVHCILLLALLSQLVHTLI